MPWLRHFALFVVFVAALFRPAASGALVSAPDAGSQVRVGAFELVTATLVGPASGATCGLHEGIGAAYDENASGYRFAAGGAARDVVVPSSRYPETAAHIRDAQAAGHPSVLTIERAGADANRAAAQAGQPRVPGTQLDEYPPAMFREGGAGASTRPVTPRDNMGAGACIGNQCRGLPDGTRVRIVVE
jgi:hypothetical protein